MSDVYVATLVAPKARELIEVWATDKKGDGFQLFAPGCPEDCKVLGESYTEEEGESLYEHNTVRVHTPEGVAAKGKGYGLVLYSGTALGVELLRYLHGVHSHENGRSPAADRFWRSARQSELAIGAIGEGEGVEGQVEHCEPIDDGNRELDDGRIISDEVCGDVTTVTRKSREYDVLLAAIVRASGLVLHHAKADAKFKKPPSDLLAGLDLTSLRTEGAVADAKFLWRVGEIIAKENLDNAKRFLRRIEVQEIVARDPAVLPTYLEFFGQTRLPGVQGLRGRALSGPILDPLLLPGPSAATRKLLDRFAAFD